MISVVFSIISDIQGVQKIMFAKINLPYINNCELEKIGKLLTS